MFYCILLFSSVPSFLLLLYYMCTLECNVLFDIVRRMGKKTKSLKGKVAWITGASAGIGEQLAYVLAENGVKLAISGRNKERLEEVRKTCLEKSNGQLKEEDVLVENFDIGDLEAHSIVAQKVINHFPKLDILVNNAGQLKVNEFEKKDHSFEQNLFQVNVFGPMNLTKIIIRHWYAKGIRGHLVFNSSLAGVASMPFGSTYAATKHAINGYVESLRFEFLLRGIKITTICPGPVETEIFERGFGSRQGADDVGGRFGGYLKNLHIFMSSKRCAELMAAAIANKVEEAWISRQPYLMLTFGQVYFKGFHLMSHFRKFLVPKKFLTTFKEQICQ